MVTLLPSVPFARARVIRVIWRKQHHASPMAGSRHSWVRRSRAAGLIRPVSRARAGRAGNPLPGGDLALPVRRAVRRAAAGSEQPPDRQDDRGGPRNGQPRHWRKIATSRKKQQAKQPPGKCRWRKFATLPFRPRCGALGRAAHQGVALRRLEHPPNTFCKTLITGTILRGRSWKATL